MWLINSPIGRKVVMSVTGICLILFLTFHACMNVVALFSGKAYNMMFAELVGIEGLAHGPADGFGWIKETFSQPVYVVLYVIWIVAIWFHLSHGFWSAMQTIGINGKIWFNRWKVIGIIYVTILMALFLIVVLAFAFGLAPSLCCGGGSCCEAAAACC